MQFVGSGGRRGVTLHFTTHAAALGYALDRTAATPPPAGPSLEGAHMSELQAIVTFGLAIFALCAIGVVVREIFKGDW